MAIMKVCWMLGKEGFWSLGVLVISSFAVGFILGLAAGEPPGQVSQTVIVGEALSGGVSVDGSSTVYPITEAVAEAFMEKHPSVVVTVGVSGTGGGFKRFIRGETDINDASRPITGWEAEQAERNGVEWVEIPVALDGLTIIVSKENTWVDCLTFEELKTIWMPGSHVRFWSDVRPGWPREEIRLYGPGPDSGTFDFFTERVVGEAGASRTDYIASEDDNVIVEGVSRERYSLGYLGYAYYVENRDRLRAVPVDGGNGCVAPTDEAITSGKYPLSRPLYIYVNVERLRERLELREFVAFYLREAPSLVPKVGYTPLPERYYRIAEALVRAGVYEDVGEIALRWVGENEEAG